MFTIFAHAGHVHSSESMTLGESIDHCLPILVGAGVIVVILLVVIVYLLTTWEPKQPKKKVSTPAKKKS